VLFVLPTLALMVVSINNYREDSTLSVMKVKETQVLLAATVVDENLDAKLELGLSFATRPQFVHRVEQGHWQEAMQIFDGVLELYPEIDRIVLYDVDAIIKAFRDIDIKARIGGDELVVLGKLRDGFDADLVMARRLKATMTYLTGNPRPYQLSLCTGIVYYDPETPCSLDELVERGDRLMYELKAKRRRTPPTPSRSSTAG
jgi:predicted signal transduction protein with EAL and GGDEF domain